METNQKTLGSLQTTLSTTLKTCQQHDDSLISGNLSPRTYTNELAQRNECYFHYNVTVTITVIMPNPQVHCLTSFHYHYFLFLTTRGCKSFLITYRSLFFLF